MSQRRSALATSSSSSNNNSDQTNNTNNTNNNNNNDNGSSNNEPNQLFQPIRGERVKKIAGKNSAFHTKGKWKKFMKRKKNNPSQKIHPKLPKRSTLGLVALYQTINPNFAYQSENNPRRVLSRYSNTVKGQGYYDSPEGNLILGYGDRLLNSRENCSYVVQELLGQGTFGQVFRCSSPSGRDVAVKVIKSTPAYRRQAISEFRLLAYLKRNVNCDRKHIVNLIDHFDFFGHICLVFEMLSMNLYELVKKNKFSGLSLNTVQVFLRDLLESLEELERHRIIHCDLKPENVLLQDYAVTPAIKLIDFGSACFENHTIFSYIQSRFYRSPEVLLGAEYGMGIDMWSLGCISAELFLGLPLFAGQDHYDQIFKIIEVLGQPPNSLLDNSRFALNYFNRQFNGVNYVYTLKTREEFYTKVPELRVLWRYNTIEELVHGVGIDPELPPESVQKEKRDREALIHFIKGLLCYDINQRWTASQAKQHPLITGETWTGSWTPPQTVYHHRPTDIPISPGIRPRSASGSGSGSGSGSHLSPFVASSSYGSQSEFPATPPSIGSANPSPLIPSHLSVGVSPSMNPNVPYLGSSHPHSRSGSFTYSNSPQTQPIPHPPMVPGRPMVAVSGSYPPPPPQPHHQHQYPYQHPQYQTQQPQPQPQPQPQQQGQSLGEDGMMFPMNDQEDSDNNTDNNEDNDDDDDSYNNNNNNNRNYTMLNEQQRQQQQQQQQMLNLQFSGMSLHNGNLPHNGSAIPQRSFGSSHSSAYGLSPVEPPLPPGPIPTHMHTQPLYPRQPPYYHYQQQNPMQPNPMYREHHPYQQQTRHPNTFPTRNYNQHQHQNHSHQQRNQRNPSSGRGGHHQGQSTSLRNRHNNGNNHSSNIPFTDGNHPHTHHRANNSNNNNNNRSNNNRNNNMHNKHSSHFPRNHQ